MESIAPPISNCTPYYMFYLWHQSTFLSYSHSIKRNPIVRYFDCYKVIHKLFSQQLNTPHKNQNGFRIFWNCVPDHAEFSLNFF